MWRLLVLVVFVVFLVVGVLWVLGVWFLSSLRFGFLGGVDRE
jgi:hypothetical protein